MERRKFLIGTGALASGSAAAVGTGAFTSVTADRDLTVNVSGDSSAFLAFDLEDEPNADYAQVNNSGDSTLEIALDGSLTDSDGNPSGDGVNEDAYTVIRDIFTITNQGTQDIYVGVDGSTLPDKPADEQPENGGPDKAIDFFSDDDSLGTGLGVGEGYGDISDKGALLSPGDTLNRCGLQVYTPIPESELPVGAVTFLAKSTAEVDSS
jgi:hypothetical protein